MPSNETEAGAIVRKVQEGEKLVASLIDQANALARELAEAKSKVAAAALAVETGAGKQKDYDAAAGEVQRLTAELSRKQFAADAAAKQVQADRAAMFKANTARREADATKLGGQRSKAVADIVAGLDQLFRGRLALHEVNTKIATVFGAAITTRHGGTLLSPDEVQRALEIEFARVTAPPPLSGNACPALPGSKSYALGGNPAAAEPLASLIERANAELTKRVTLAPVAVTEAPKPAPVRTAATDPDDKLLTEPAPQTVSAEQVMPAARALKI